jgi:hypothetical protein
VGSEFFMSFQFDVDPKVAAVVEKTQGSVENGTWSKGSTSTKPDMPRSCWTTPRTTFRSV